MQISRHWRLKTQRYRLAGVRYADGDVNLQARPKSQHEEEETRVVEQVPDEEVAVAAAH